MFGSVLLMASPSGGGSGSGAMSFFIMMALIIGVMYFFMIRPQQKKEKSRQKMISELKKGDKVVTSAGILGTIWGMKDNIVVLKVDDNVKVEFLKNAITTKIEG